MAKKAKRSGLMELGRKALKAQQHGSEALGTPLTAVKRQRLAYALLGYKPKRPRGRPKGTVSIVTREAAADYYRLMQAMHDEGFKGRHGLSEKIIKLIVKKRVARGVGAPDPRSLKNYLRRSKRQQKRSKNSAV